MLELHGDFNGVWGDEGGLLLCLSHSEKLRLFGREQVEPIQGAEAVALEEDYEDNVRDGLLAFGTIMRSPEWLQYEGSKWCLKVDDRGVHHESDSRQS